MKTIHYGGKLHGCILHNATVPRGTQMLGKCALIVHPDSPKDQLFRNTIEFWNRWLKEPSLFIGIRIKKKQPLMKHEPEGPHRYTSV